jgi:GT2 family glycosyltransferase
MKTAVVILNWNGKKFLENFLPGINTSLPADAALIIADNASTDDSVEFLKQNYPQVRIIINSENGGFAKGYNDALSRIEAQYFVLLNSDIEVRGKWIEPVISLFETNTEIAAIQPKILSYHEPEKFEYAGASGGFIDTFGYPFCRGRIFQHLENDNNQYNDNTEVFWATGACLFIRSDIYKKVGGLDNDFFAHMEEIDLCWRIKNLGYKIMVCPESEVFHVGGGTLPKKSWKKTYLNMRNNNIMLLKNLPKRYLIPIFFSRFILDWVAAFKFLFDGGWMDFGAVIRAQFSFIKSIPKTIQKRHQYKRRPVSCVYKGNIVLEYFLLRRTTFEKLNFKKFS